MVQTRKARLFVLPKLLDEMWSMFLTKITKCFLRMLVITFGWRVVYMIVIILFTDATTLLKMMLRWHHGICKSESTISLWAAGVCWITYFSGNMTNDSVG